MVLDFPALKRRAIIERGTQACCLCGQPRKHSGVFRVHRSKTPLSAQTGSLCSVLDFPALKRRAIINVEGMRI